MKPPPLKPTDDPEMAYFCSHDGYDPGNRGWWCNIGCGRDYNRMIAVPKRLVDKLIAQTMSDRFHSGSLSEGVLSDRGSDVGAGGKPHRTGSVSAPSESEDSPRSLSEGGTCKSEETPWVAQAAPPSESDGRNRFPLTMPAMCSCGHDANYHAIPPDTFCSQCDCKEFDSGVEPMEGRFQ